MRGPLDFDDIEGIERAGSPKRHRAAAATLLAWAQERHPDDEVTPADLLSSAAWHLQQAGDVEESLDLYRKAVAAEGRTSPDVRVQLHAALLDAGRLDEARQTADEIRRSSPPLADLAMMAENFEMAGDLEAANRWVAMAMNRLDLEAEPARDERNIDLIVLLNIRRRVREALGFPPDELDEMRP